jgi:ATP-binding protein involved in chromosome partitioning
MNEIKHIIAVASGKGGVGKSTTAVNLALALKARGLAVGLLDADIYGPSQQLMLGVAEGTRPGQQDGRFLLPVEALGLKTMSMGYLVTEGTPMVWRGPMAGGALAQMLEQTLWGALDVLVIDMPPGTGDIQLTLSQKASVAGAVIVTTPQDIALLDAKKGIEMFRKVDIPILGVVENMALHICSNCGHVDHIFGADGGQRIAEQYGVALLGSLPLARSIREQTDSGRPTVSAEPESPVTAIYLQIADTVWAALNGAVEDFPTIDIADD